MRLTLHQFLTLDGVYQAPGGQDEDRAGGFEHGGWQVAYRTPAAGAMVAGWFGQASAFLLGRRTYDIFSGSWPHVRDHPIADQLNALPKYVASTTLSSVDWDNSSLLGGDVMAEITELKEQPGGELQVHGSGGLAQSLMEHDLIDEYRLVYFPLLVGSGKKLFRDGARPAALRLVSSQVTPGGVFFACYQPAGDVQHAAPVNADKRSEHWARVNPHRLESGRGIQLPVCTDP